MKFLYKIHSGYDGFYPRRIPDRFLEPNLLRLGWDRYVDVIEEGSEVWVYFHGPHQFENGVYVKGFIRSIETKRLSVLLRVREYSTKNPLTNKDESGRVAVVVSPRYRQVFLLPEEWLTVPNCSISSTAESCSRRDCEKCTTWKGLLLIKPDSFYNPIRLPVSINSFVPAYWVIPSRCYLGSQVGRKIRNTSELFYRFKLGETSLAFPLALGIYYSLQVRKLLDFEAVVPIPLSPDKVKKGEINRSQLLARELGRLLGVPVLELLGLKQPITKKSRLAMGITAKQFEDEYYESLEVDGEIPMPDRLLLIDDVCTRGSTLRSASKRLAEIKPCNITAVTAGQMILKEVVNNEEDLVTN